MLSYIDRQAVRLRGSEEGRGKQVLKRTFIRS